eukprot:gene13370-15798_t
MVVLRAKGVRNSRACLPSRIAVLRMIEPDEFLVAYFGGSKEGAKDVAIWTSRKQADAKVWDPPVMVVDESGVPLWNPVLFKVPATGEVLLFFKVLFSNRLPAFETDGKQQRPSASTSPMSSEHSTSVLPRLRGSINGHGPETNEVQSTASCFRRNSVIEGAGNTSAARVASCPVPSHEACSRLARFLMVLARLVLTSGLAVALNSEQAETNKEGRAEVAAKAPPKRGNLSERSGRFTGVAGAALLCPLQEFLWPLGYAPFNNAHASSIIEVVTSTSYDGGYQWPPASPTDVPNPNCGFDVVKLTDGRVVMVHNTVNRAVLE